MSVFLQPIYTQTASGSASSITFNNIPQFYTDLIIVASLRESLAAGDEVAYLQFNSDASSGLYSETRIYGSGSSASSDRASGQNYIRALHSMGSTSTANSYTNCSVYIPNYSGNTFKSTLSDYVTEQNSGAASTYQVEVSGLWRKTDAITKIQILVTGNFTNASTISLYGILRAGA